MLVSLSLNRWEAGALLGLFAVQFVIPIAEVRIVVAIVYIVLAAVLFVRQRRHIAAALRETRSILRRRSADAL